MASLFRRMLSSIDSVKSKFEMSIYGSIIGKYPEIDQLMEIVALMRRKYNEQCIAIGIADDVDGDGIIDEDEDDRYVPTALTVALIYKLQKNDCKRWYNVPEVRMNDPDRQERLLHTFGYYWHLLVNVSKCLRNSNPECVNFEDGGDGDASAVVCKDDETIQAQMKTVIGLEPEDLLLAHASDKNGLGDHCPDFALTLQREHKLVILTICGTRMIPAPEMKDVFMDLYADTEKFLHGHAHRGMAIGCNNILEKVLDLIVENLEKYSDYSLLITGYSLGAGISQLVTMELLEGSSSERIPEGTEIRCISYGTPPVFKSDLESDGCTDYKLPNIFSIGYNNDGLISASMANVIKLFMQIRALEQMELRRRDMCRLLFTNVELTDEDSGDEEEEEQVQNNADDDDDEDTDEEDTDTDKLASSKWNQVRVALEKVENVADLVHLEHPSQLYLFKRKNDVVTRVFNDTMPFTNSLRLRGSMFNDHMPWGYGALFEGYGLASENISIPDLIITEESSEQQESV